MGRLTGLYKLVYETVRDLEVKWAFSNKQLNTNANKHKSKQAKAVSYHKYTSMSTKQQDDSNFNMLEPKTQQLMHADESAYSVPKGNFKGENKLSNKLMK